MEELTVATVYGKALYDVAIETEKAAETDREVEILLAIFAGEPAFFTFFCSPLISGTEKKKLLEKVLFGKISEELLHLLFILSDKRRGHSFPVIVKEYQRLRRMEAGFSQGVIYTAFPLSTEKLALFEKKVGELLQERIQLLPRVDESVLGGARIYIKGKCIDATLAKRLSELGEQMKG